MTFLAHGAMGGGILGLILRALNAPRWAVNVAVSLGAALGMMPDALDWLLANLTLTTRWQIYDWFHHDCPGWLLAWPPIWLHVGLDRLIHLSPGYNWWPAFWYLEVGMWVVAASMLKVLYDKELRAAWASFLEWLRHF